MNLDYRLTPPKCGLPVHLCLKKHWVKNTERMSTILSPSREPDTAIFGQCCQSADLFQVFSYYKNIFKLLTVYFL